MSYAKYTREMPTEAVGATTSMAGVLWHLGLTAPSARPIAAAARADRVRAAVPLRRMRRHARNGRPLMPHVDHSDGRCWDCRPENLRSLCANCHSWTGTYAGRNRPRGGTAVVRVDEHGGLAAPVAATVTGEDKWIAVLVVRAAEKSPSPTPPGCSAATASTCTRSGAACRSAARSRGRLCSARARRNGIRTPSWRSLRRIRRGSAEARRGAAGGFGRADHPRSRHGDRRPAAGRARHANARSATAEAPRGGLGASAVRSPTAEVPRTVAAENVDEVAATAQAEHR